MGETPLRGDPADQAFAWLHGGSIPRPGSRWLHVKSGEAVTVVVISLRECDLTPLVTYAEDAAPADRLWTRTAGEFCDNRFVPAG